MGYELPAADPDHMHLTLAGISKLIHPQEVYKLSQELPTGFETISEDFARKRIVKTNE